MKDFLNSLLRRTSKGESVSDFAAVERAERIFYLQYLREGMTVFDAGANVGELTLLFSRFVGENGTVHAFEAALSVYEKLEIICRAAGRRNVRLNHLALAETSGEIRLNVYDEAYSAFNSQAARPLEDYGLDLKPAGTETVRAVALDEYCEENRVETIDLLKIDVEGAELQVMRGALGMLKAKKIRCLTFEFGQTTFDMGNDPSEIEDLLTGCGYRIRNLMANEPIFPGRESVATARYAMHVAT